MDKQYKLVEPSQEEVSNFNEELELLLEKHSFQLGVVPQFQPNDVTKAFEVKGVILVQKKVEVEIVEKVEGKVVSPIQVDDLPTETA